MSLKKTSELLLKRRRMVKFAFAMNIIRHIEYLLQHNDCVVVAGLGAFICHEAQAEANQATCCPPKRTLSFNGAIVHNDGLLCNSIMRIEGCSYVAAADAVNAFVGELKEALSEQGRVSIGEIGDLLYSESGCLAFEPKEHSDIANFANYGLKPVNIQLLADSETTTEVAQKRILGFGKQFVRIAASIVVIIVLAITLTTPMPMDSIVDKAAVSSVSTTKKMKPMVQKQNVGNPQQQQAADSANMQSEKQSEQVGRYCVVIASLTSRAQAEKYINESNEEGLFIVNASRGSSIYKVALASGETREEMNSLIREKHLSDKYPDIWVCRK